MKIVFVSNYMNHHQLYLCDEFIKQSESFFFISTDNNIQGFQAQIDAACVLNYHKERDRCDNIIFNADICIYGACPNDLIDIRMKDDKLSFLYTERPFKKGKWRKFIPSTYEKVKNRFLKYKDKQLYILCAGAFVSDDLKSINFPIEKCFKWGYFPETRSYNDVNQIIKNKKMDSIIWCGRFLDWKHPEIVIKLSKKIKKNGFNFHVKMYGEGPLEEYLTKCVKNYHLSDCVEINKPLSPKKIRDEMEKSALFLLTSDRYEGWGAVLNEAMNSGCAVIANKDAGSAPYLLKNNKNGVICNTSDIDRVSHIVEDLLSNLDKLQKFGNEAYNTINDEWNANVAVKRLIAITEMILKHEECNIFESGPCSKA